MAEKFDFVTTDAQEIYNTVLDSLMDEVNEPLYAGDERRIFGEALVVVLVALYSKMNDTAKQRMLQHARGYVLDAIGEMRQTPRLQPSAARDTFRFTVSAEQSTNIVIPAGTRITPDGVVYFATLAAAVLQAGETYVDVVAECSTPGADYNGLNVGTINVLVDLIPFIASVSNLNGTSGGDDGEPYPWEDDGSGDERYRERIQLAPTAYSVAATLPSFKYFALSANPNIVDVSVVNPSANVIDIYALMEGGAIPTAEELAEIEAVFTDVVRIMTDQVTAKAPTQEEYGIELKYYCSVENEALAVQSVEGVGGAIEIYNAWQTAALGRDINPDQLRAYIKKSDGSTGVDRVEIVSPVYTNLTRTQVAKFNGTLTVTHEVVAE